MVNNGYLLVGTSTSDISAFENGSKSVRSEGSGDGGGVSFGLKGLYQGVSFTGHGALSGINEA